MASLPARDGRAITGYCPCRRREGWRGQEQTGNPIPFSATTNQPSVRPASVMQSTPFPAGSLMTMQESWSCGLVELTVPGGKRGAAAAEVLARHRQDVAPAAWFRPGNTDCNGGRSTRQPKTHHNKVWVPFSLPSLGFALGWPTKAAPRHGCIFSATRTSSSRGPPLCV